jgi:hypothetical protein
MTEHMPSRVRYLVAFLSVLAGIGYTAFDAVYARGGLPRSTSNDAGQLSPEESRFVFDACVTFYGTVYWCGRRLYALLGRRAAAAELNQWSAWHLRVLNAFGGAWLLSSGWRSFVTAGLVRPSLLVAVVLLVQAAIDFVTAAFARQRGGLAGT